MGVSSVVYIQNTTPFSHLKVSVVPWYSFLSTDNTKIAFWAQKALSPGGVSIWVSLFLSSLPVAACAASCPPQALSWACRVCPQEVGSTCAAPKPNPPTARLCAAFQLRMVLTLFNDWGENIKEEYFMTHENDRKLKFWNHKILIFISENLFSLLLYNFYTVFSIANLKIFPVLPFPERSTDSNCMESDPPNRCDRLCVPRRYKSCPNSYALLVEIRGMVCFLLCQAGPLASGSSVVPWAHPAEFVLWCCPLPLVFEHGVVCAGGSDVTWPPHGLDLVMCTSQFPLRLWRKRVRGRLPSTQVLKVVVKEAFTLSSLQCEVEAWRDGGNRSKSFRRIQGTTGRRAPFPYSMPTWRIHLRNHSEPLRFGSQLFLRGSMVLGSQKYSSLILPKALCC